MLKYKLPQALVERIDRGSIGMQENQKILDRYTLELLLMHYHLVTGCRMVITREGSEDSLGSRRVDGFLIMDDKDDWEFSSIRTVAILGPFTADTNWQRDLNIDAADMLAFEVQKLGAHAYCPHRLTGHWYGRLPEQQIIEGHRAILRHLDSAMMVEGWEQSKDSIEDKAIFDRQGKPIFYRLQELERWLHS